MLVDLVRQRIFGLIYGYPDCNDAARLTDDAIHKLLLDRDPLAAPPWPRSPPFPASRMPAAPWP